MPYATKECEDIKEFFQQEYDVHDKNMRLLINSSYEECESVYSAADLGMKLSKDRAKSFVIHVFSGKG